MIVFGHFKIIYKATSPFSKTAEEKVESHVYRAQLAKMEHSLIRLSLCAY
jgi:hypothetical protein